MPRTTAEHAEIAENFIGLVLSSLRGLCGERFHSFRKSINRRVLLATALASGVVFASAGSAAQLPLEPSRESGQSVTPAYDGWFKNPDGTFSLLLGYFHRNSKQVLDIPVGPDNRIEPAGPDRGQPTHFLIRRQWGVFTVVVPADFGDKKITWTLTANGKTTSVPMGLHRDYEIDPFRDAAEKNTPPVLKFQPQGTPLQGPPRGISASYDAMVRSPLTLTIWASDDAIVDPSRRAPEAPVTVSWSLFRGPGAVTFSNLKPPVDKTDGKATTTATFSQAGEYIILAQANDVSGEGGGGFQCCWTNAHVKVTVK